MTARFATGESRAVRVGVHIAEQECPVLGHGKDRWREVPGRAGLHARADSLNRIDFELSGRTPTYFGMEALLALAAGDSARAERAAQECLAWRPNDDEGLEVMRVLGR